MLAKYYRKCYINIKAYIFAFNITNFRMIFIGDGLCWTQKSSL